jgi:hypothetical protein
VRPEALSRNFVSEFTLRHKHNVGFVDPHTATLCHSGWCRMWCNEEREATALAYSSFANDALTDGNLARASEWLEKARLARAKLDRERQICSNFPLKVVWCASSLVNTNHTNRNKIPYQRAHCCLY